MNYGNAYGVTTVQACKQTYGNDSDTFHDARVLIDSKMKFKKEFVDKQLTNEDDPLLLISSSRGLRTKVDIDKKTVEIAMECLLKVVYHPNFNQRQTAADEYTASEIRGELERFKQRYLRMDEQNMQAPKMISRCPRFVDPIVMLGECQQQCMGATYKNRAGKSVFSPVRVIDQLGKLEESIKSDLVFVESLLCDGRRREGCVGGCEWDAAAGRCRYGGARRGGQLAQLHGLRGTGARRELAKRALDRDRATAGDESAGKDLVDKELKEKYGARGTQVMGASAALKDRLKKQRRKRIKDLFALAQRGGNNSEIRKNLLNFLTMDRVVDMGTKSLKINRRPGGGNYYRPAEKRQTTPELRLTDRAIKSIVDRFRDRPDAPGARRLIASDFPKLDRPLRLKGTTVAQGGDRKDHGRLEALGVKQRLVPRDGDSRVTLRATKLRGKGSEIDLPRAVLDALLPAGTAVRVDDLASTSRPEALPLISAGDYIRHGDSYLRVEIDRTDQRMVLGPAGEKLFGVEVRHGDATNFKGMREKLATLIRRKFIQATEDAKRAGGRTAHIDKRIAMDKEIYLPDAITLVVAGGRVHAGRIRRRGGGGDSMNAQFVVEHVQPQTRSLGDGVYFILGTNVGGEVLTREAATARLRRRVREGDRKKLSQEVLMWYTKDDVDTRDVMLSPISPVLDYIREKRGMTRLSYKYDKKIGSAREAEKKRRLPTKST